MMFGNSGDSFVECLGAIEQFGIWEPYDYWRVRVSYVVAGARYEITESVKMVSRSIKLGPIPIGQEQVPKLPTTEVGAAVTVCYDPNQPLRAYLRDNEGHMTTD